MSYDREEWRRPWRAGDPPLTGHPGGDATAPASQSAQDRQAPGPLAPAGEPLRFPRPLAADDAAGSAQADRTPATWTDAAAPGPDAATDTAGSPAAPPAGSQNRGRFWRGLVVALVGGVVGAMVTLAVTSGFDEVVAPGGTASPRLEEDAAPAPVLGPPEADSIVPAVAEAVTPSVVRIDVTTSEGPEFPRRGGGLGSGVVYTRDGYIITNHHVVEGAGDVTVRLADGEVLEASVVGTDELNDIAVVRIERDGLQAISIRPRDEPLRVGETVIAIGSPFGLDASVSSGIISALDREIRLEESADAGGVLTIPSVVQTDAAINPGNSGGALVDSRGRLVGINTAILTGTGANQGVGFAVSAQQVRRSADQLIEQGFVRHPLLGIAGTDVGPEEAEELGLDSPRGAVIEVVEEGSGADAADLRTGDVITAVDGVPLATMSELVAEVRRRAPGEVLSLVVVRDGEELEIDVELGERPR